MAILGDKRDKARSTLVGFHDLLGFGELLSASGGTLDSAVGELAYRRVLGLRHSVNDIESLFPKGTMFFHFNDTVTAYLDVDVEIGSSHTDPGGIAALPIRYSEYGKILKFVSGCANLHQRSIAREDEERLGPAGRTFVVLGKRWDLGKVHSKRVFEVPPLQANLAFAEAYAADQAGSNKGFSHRTYHRLYLNDHIWFLLCAGVHTLKSEQQLRLAELGARSRDFPYNLNPNDTKPVPIEIFHRLRNFHSVMSHHACEIAKALKDS
jgi:hypothetical protein